jgi:hypothetical protein
VFGFNLLFLLWDVNNALGTRQGLGSLEGTLSQLKIWEDIINWNDSTREAYGVFQER